MGLLDLFFTPEPGAAPQPNTTAPASTNQQYSGASPQTVNPGQAYGQYQPPTQQYQTPGYTPAPVAGVVDQKYIEHFEKLLADSNFEGTDYYEFSNALKSMRSAGLPEAQLFQFTFNSMKAMSQNTSAPELVAKLVDTADKYIAIINQNKVDFERDVKDAQLNKVGNLQTRVDVLNKENTDATEQIRVLQEKIQANTAEITQISGDMATQNAKLVTSQNNYHATHALIVSSIEGDREKIKTYLTGIA